MSRFIDAHGLTVEVTPTHYVVRSPEGVLLGQALGADIPLPRTPADLEALGVDLATLQEVPA